MSQYFPWDICIVFLSGWFPPGAPFFSPVKYISPIQLPLYGDVYPSYLDFLEILHRRLSLFYLPVQLPLLLIYIVPHHKSSIRTA